MAGAPARLHPLIGAVQLTPNFYRYRSAPASLSVVTAAVVVTFGEIETSPEKRGNTRSQY